jgi:hypothetical protein
MQASSRWDLTRGDLCSRLHARATDFHFTNRGTVLVSFFLFRPHRGVSGDQPIRPPSPPTNSVRTCPQRTQTAPIYSAQIRPSVRKRPQLGWELRDRALRAKRKTRSRANRTKVPLEMSNELESDRAMVMNLERFGVDGVGYVVGHLRPRPSRQVRQTRSEDHVSGHSDCTFPA